MSSNIHSFRATIGAKLRVLSKFQRPTGADQAISSGSSYLGAALPLRALCLVVGCSLTPGTSFAENWMTAPQISSQAAVIAATDDDEASDFVSAYKGPCDVAASPDGERLYVVENDARALAVVSVAEGKVVQTIPLPDEPTGVCIRPDSKSAYVTCGVANGLLCVVDLSSGKVTARLPAGHSPRGPSLSPNGERDYVCNRFDNSVSVVDLAAKLELAHQAPTDLASIARPRKRVVAAKMFGEQRRSEADSTERKRVLPARYMGELRKQEAASTHAGQAHRPRSLLPPGPEDGSPRPPSAQQRDRNRRRWSGGRYRQQTSGGGFPRCQNSHARW